MALDYGKRQRHWPLRIALLGVNAVALIVTRQSLSTDEFDGLNNIWQILLGLPWTLIPMPSAWSYLDVTWVHFAFGALNAALLTRGRSATPTMGDHHGVGKGAVARMWKARTLRP